MSEDGQNNPPEDTPPANPFASDDFKNAVKSILAEDRKANPTPPSAPASGSNSGTDIRSMFNSLMDERESRAKESTETGQLRKELDEVKAQLAKQSKRFFSIFD